MTKLPQLARVQLNWPHKRSGTVFEGGWVNVLFGLLSALLNAAAFIPSLQLCTDLQRPWFVVDEDKWSCQLMWAIDQISSQTFQNNESTLDKEWLGQAVWWLRLDTLGLNYDVLLTLTQFPYHSEVSKSGSLLFWRQGFDPFFRANSFGVCQSSALWGLSSL